MFNKINTVYILCLSEIHFCNNEDLADYTERLNNSVLGAYKKFGDAVEAALSYSITSNTTLMYKDYKIVNDNVLQFWYEDKNRNNICKEFRILRRRIE